MMPHAVLAASMGRMLALGGVTMLLSHCASPPARSFPTNADHPRTGAAISRAVGYLRQTQATAETERSSPLASMEGDWDQYLGLRIGPFHRSIHDTSPFTPAGVVHSLRHVSALNTVTLGIPSEDAARAREIRSKVIKLIRRFEKEDGTVGYWLEVEEPKTLGEKLHAEAIRLFLKGPSLHGTLAPRGLGALPPEFRVPTDPDTTSIAWVARSLDDSLNGTANRHRDLLEVIRPYKWSGNDPLYFPKSFVPPPGVFCSFCIPPQSRDIPREVDLVVNCHILYALALNGHSGSPEARRIISWILDVVRSGQHRRFDELVMYYRWENKIGYVVSSCYHDGGVKALAPAVETLAADARATARTSRDGTVFWEGRSRTRSTAYAVLTLLNAGDRGPLVEGGVKYLLANQQRRSGGWRDSWVHMMETESGRIIDFRSDAAVTASVLEALCRYQLANPAAVAPASRARRS
jgi:hypothetical protein